MHPESGRAAHVAGFVTCHGVKINSSMCSRRIYSSTFSAFVTHLADIFISCPPGSSAHQCIIKQKKRLPSCIKALHYPFSLSYRFVFPIFIRLLHLWQVQIARAQQIGQQNPHSSSVAENAAFQIAPVFVHPRLTLLPFPASILLYSLYAGASLG